MKKKYDFRYLTSNSLDYVTCTLCGAMVLDYWIVRDVSDRRELEFWPREVHTEWHESQGHVKKPDTPVRGKRG